MKRGPRSISVFFVVVAEFLLSFVTGCDKADSLFVCSDSIGCVTIAPGKPVKVGVLQALSGEVAPLGRAQMRGLELALEKRGGRILGHPVLLQTEDTGCSPEGGANAALKIIADPESVAIYGTTCSADAATASQVMSDAGLTMISGNNSAPFLTSIAGKAALDRHPGYFRTASNEENAGKAAAVFSYKILGVHKVAIIHDGDIYTMGLANGFAKAFEKQGGTVVLSTSINKGDTDMRPVLTAVVNSQAELLFFPLYQPEGNHLLQQARKNIALNKTVLMSDGALIENSFIEAVANDAKGMYFIGPVRPAGPEVEQMDAVYEKKYGEKASVSYYLSGYDAANLLFHAIEQAAICEQSGTLHIGRQKLRDTLHGIKTFKGVTGTLHCDQFGDCGQSAFNVLQLLDPSQGIAGLESNIIYNYLPGTSKRAN